MEKKRWHKLLAVVLTLFMLAGQIFMAPAAVAAIGGDLEPGEVRTYKTATPVPGMVNTWDVKLRIEGRDDVQTLTTDIVLVMDRSGSMGGTSGRMTAAKTAAKSFIDHMIDNDSNLRIGLVSFATDASQEQVFTRNKTNLKSSVDGYVATGGTHTQAGLYKARALMNTSTADRRFIVFLSDGEPTYSYEPASWTNPTETLPGYYFDDGAQGSFTYKNYYAVYNGNYTTTRVGSGSLIRSSTETHNGSRYWPQEVGGTVYYPLDRSGNSQNRTYTAKNMYYIDNGLAAVRAATDTKGDPGFTGLFTIALSAGTEGTSILQQIATSPGMAYSTGNPADLQSIYDAIGVAISTQHAINNAVITDEMGDGFQLISGSIATTEGTTSVAAAGGGKNQTITWTISPHVNAKIGTTDVRFAEMTYRIEITPAILTAVPATVVTDPEHNLFLTNKSTQMAYRNFSGASATAGFVSPQVDPVLLKIKKILTDAQGNVIPSDPRLFNVKIKKGTQFDHTENLVVGADYVWLTTLRYEGRYDVTEIGVDGSAGALDQFDIYYKLDGVEGQTYFDVFHETGAIPRGDVTIEVRNRENLVRVQLNGSKTLTGRTDTSVADSFKFKLTGLSGARMPDVDEGTLTFNGNGTQNFSFGPIAYTLSDLGGQASKVLTYQISEIKPSPGISGMVYDSSLVRTVTVTLTKSAAGLIQAAVSPTEVTFNNHYEATGSFLPLARKNLIGRALAAGEFTFHLKELVPGSDPEVWTLVESQQNLADGTIPFTAIPYTIADLGVHTYKITEDSSVPGGISHDPLEIIYTVTVTDNKDGSLNVAYGAPADTQFDNTYLASGSWTPQVTKKLLGRTLTNGEFSFELKDEEGGILDTVTNALNGQVTFGAISYTQADIGKTYTYTIQEVIPAAGENGMTYDPMVVTVTVHVTDAGNGQLGISPVYPADTEFNNVYAASGSFAPQVNKELAGRALADGEFSFELRDGEGALLETKTNTAAGQVIFGAISYTQADIGKTFTYTIKEVFPSSPEAGMTYDPMTVTVTVSVLDAGGGVLTVIPTYSSDRTFNNSYAASGSFIPQVTKTLEGRALTNGEFSFQLKDAEGRVLETVTNALNGQVTFGAISYTQADIGKTYTYTIQEVIPATPESGMTYDPMVVTVTVTVADAGHGVLTVTAAYPADKEFNNSYAASGSFTPVVSKALTGRELTAGAFTFALKKNGIVLQTKTNAADGTVTFDPILYDEGDIGQTYAYIIVEVTPASPETGMTYDSLAVTITVDIEDAGQGELTVTSHYPADTEFNNAYTASGSWIPQVTKKLEGRALTSGEFSFQLKNAEGAVLETASNTAGGQVTFGAISYTQADIGKTFTYTIEEVIPSVPEGGMTYDTMTVAVTVTVADAGNGALTVTRSYPADKEFNNSYQAAGSWTPAASKALAGRQLEGGAFSFVLKKGGTIIETKANGAGGQVVFGTLSYTQADIGKTYTYTIEEVVPATPESGMSYDAMVVTIPVTITDAGGGVLTVTASYPEDTEFNNVYRASGSFIPLVNKALAGRILAEDEFSFELRDAEGALLETATNTSGGQVTFGAISYTQADIGKTFTYTIKEVIPALPEGGMTYDPMTVTVTVSVLDAGGGVLTVIPTYPSDRTFNNSYAAAGFWAPAVSKALVGRVLTGGEFTFALKKDGTPLASKTNAADGSVTFDALPFSQDDIGKTYVFTIEEVVPPTPEGGMTYDPMVVTIPLAITDAGNGLLTLTASYPEDMEFNNIYEASGSWIPAVSKTLAGRELSAGEFTFALKKGTAILQTAANAADGSVTFAPISYTQDDIGETYTYTIVEVVPASPETGIEFDPLEVTVSVEVQDAGDGVLTVTPSYSEDTEFNNVYRARGEWTPYATKSLVAGGRILTGGDFTFELRDEDGVLWQTRTNTASGQINFGSMNYNEMAIGKTYYYTIKEVVPDPAEGGMIYDPMVLTIKVEIADAGNGLLEVTVTYPEDTEFNNVYQATGEWIPEVGKVLTGRALTDGEFSFELLDSEGTVIGTAVNDPDGRVVFAPLTYTEADVGLEAGVFDYTIREVVPAAPEDGMIYDPMVLAVKVVVNDAGGGLLDIYADYPEDTVFNNRYQAENSLLLEGWKELYGRTIAAGEFTFLLKDEAGSVIQTVTNAMDGSFGFVLDYTEADIGNIYEYTIQEEAGTEAGMTYDGNVIQVTVRVTDAGDGILDLDVTMNGDINFENIYQASGSYLPDVGKVLIGRALIDGEFEFELLDEEGNVLQTATNDGDGKVLFDPLLFDQDDAGKTMIYKVREKNGGHGNIGYDASEFLLTLTVQDLGGGTLAVARTLEEEEIIFTNSWKVADIHATKTWIGGYPEKPVIWFKLMRQIEGGIPEEVPGASILELDRITEVVWPGQAVFAPGGETYIYSVREVDALGNPLVLVDHEKIEYGLTVTNTFIGEKVSPTGERSPIILIGLFTGLALLLGAGGVFLARKKRQEDSGR